MDDFIRSPGSNDSITEEEKADIVQYETLLKRQAKKAQSLEALVEKYSGLSK